MSNLLALLSQASSSLGAASAWSATAGHNLQNLGTVGYARQRVTLVASDAQRLAWGWLGAGVAVQGIGQIRDRFLEAQLPASLAAEASARAEAEALRAVRVFDTDLAGGLSDALSTFYGKLRSLSTRPDDPVLRAEALRAAEGLARSFQRTAGGIRGAQEALDLQLRDTLPSVGDAAARFADLNRQIRAASAGGAPPNDLLDARQRLQDELVARTGATPVQESNGDVHLLLPGGQALVSGTAAGRLTAAPDPANGGLLALQIDPPGTAVRSLRGSLGGLLAARDGALAEAASALDRLAWDLGSALNAIHAAGTGTDGSTGLDLFSLGPSAAGAAARIAVALSDPAQLATAGVGAGSGDGTNLLALIATETSADPAGTLGSIIAAFGGAAARAATAADHEGAILDNLQALRESVSGVSLDEELIELTRAQRSYEAVSKVIQATDAMLETLLQLK